MNWKHLKAMKKFTHLKWQNFLKMKNKILKYTYKFWKKKPGNLNKTQNSI